MKRVSSPICVVVMLALSAWGQAPQTTTPPNAPATREDVLTLFDTLRIRQQMERVLAAVSGQMQRTMTDMVRKQLPNAKPEELARFDSFMEETQQEARNVYPVPEMLDDMVPTYQKHLTHGDIQAVLAFYKSPVGQKLLSEQPAMTQEAMQVINAKMQPRLERLMAKTTARAQAMAEEMIKETGKQPAPTPTAPPKK